MAKLKTGPKVKRKGGGIPMKAKKVEGLTAEIAAASSFVVTEYRGLKVAELQQLRRRLRPRGIEYHVVKNSLFARAAEKSGKAELRSILAGPTAVAIGNGDEVELAKSLVEEARLLKALKILGNLATLIEAVNRARPSGIKGTYIRAAHITSTQGPSAKIELGALNELAGQART